MIRFRPKLGSERDSEWRCCFCLHVRTGTILLGSWHLLLHLVALGLLAAIARDPRLMDEMQQDPMLAPDWRDAMPTPLSNVDPQRTAHPKDHSLIYLCTLAITLMLIYGAARGKPGHLLPFFCLQIFDFAITVLTATGYMCYLRSIHRLVAETRRVPWRDELLALPAPTLALLVLSAFLAAIFLKGYCISMVWRCYKYLTMRAHALHSLTPFVISSEGVLSRGGGGAVGSVGVVGYAPPQPAPDYSSLLPDYEEAVKQTTPPPTYRAATLMAAAEPDLVATPTTPGQPVGPAASVEPPPQPPVANTVVMLPNQQSQASV